MSISDMIRELAIMSEIEKQDDNVYIQSARESLLTCPLKRVLHRSVNVAVDILSPGVEDRV